MVNLAIVDADTYRTRLAKGDFTLALYSYTAGDELHTVFRHYGSAGSAPVREAPPVECFDLRQVVFIQSLQQHCT